MTGIKIIALTDSGKQLAEVLLKHLPNAELLFKPKPFAETVQQAYEAGNRLICICATGIIIRSLAPVLKDKYQDPAVLALDELGQFVIPLLSGHEGGANDWAFEISELLGAQLVKTTAKNYIQPKYMVGLGCERNCPIEYIDSLLHECLNLAGIQSNQINGFYSIDIKSDEVAMMAIAEKYQVSFHTYTPEQLRQVEGQLQNPSEYVFKTVGVYGVAESAALYAASQINETVELIVPKHKNSKATCAITRVYAQ